MTHPKPTRADVLAAEALLRRADAEDLEASRLLHVTFVARKMNVSKRSVLRWIKSGKVKSIRTPSGAHRISSEEFERLMPPQKLWQ